MNSTETLLITAFEPFGKEMINASQKAVELLPGLYRELEADKKEYSSCI